MVVRLIGFLKMIRALLYRWSLNKVLTNSKLNRRQRCLELIQILKGENAKNRIGLKQSVMLTVPYKSIVAYTKALREFNLYISRNLPISSHMLSTDEESVPFDFFFTDEQNFYVDISVSFNSFLNECELLMENLSAADNAEYGYHEHTGRLLTNVVLNIESTLTKIANRLV